MKTALFLATLIISLSATKNAYAACKPESCPGVCVGLNCMMVSQETLDAILKDAGIEKADQSANDADWE